MKTAHITDFFEKVLPAIEGALGRVLPSGDQTPAKLHEAMRYSVFAGGKRLRPALCVAGFSTFRPDWERILPTAVSLELIHTYSLIHDDLPAMDNDDFRRGAPSCHRKFGEAIAILAGDGLLTLAFETLGRAGEFPPERILGASRMVAQAAGTSEGMIAGQVLDLEAEGAQVDASQIELIHRSKTGALLEASIAIGAYLAEAGTAEMASVTVYGQKIGLAFQIVDDILDETVPSLTLGKTSGKDREQRKATYPRLHGIEDSKRMVRRITAQARESVATLGDRARLLVEIADYLESRSN